MAYPRNEYSSLASTVTTTEVLFFTGENKTTQLFQALKIFNASLFLIGTVPVHKIQHIECMTFFQIKGSKLNYSRICKHQKYFSMHMQYMYSYCLSLVGSLAVLRRIQCCRGVSKRHRLNAGQGESTLQYYCSYYTRSYIGGCCHW